MEHRVFVYGSLLAGEEHHAAIWFQAPEQRLERFRIEGPRLDGVGIGARHPARAGSQTGLQLVLVVLRVERAKRRRGHELVGHCALGLTTDDRKVLAEVVAPTGAVPAGTADQVGLQEDPVAHAELPDPLPERRHAPGGLVARGDGEIDEGVVALQRMQV